jgi:Asp-tRNA(Asn)/Glu-tRNA(Gln) amidotransferase A subunit family amidase
LKAFITIDEASVLQAAREADRSLRAGRRAPLLGVPLAVKDSHLTADIFLSRNTHPSSAAGVPGISVPMGLNSDGLPLGLELDAAVGHDRDLLVLARTVEQIIGRVPAPSGL